MADPGTSRGWAFYVLGAYPIVFLVGVVAVFWTLTTATDPSLFSGGMFGGYVFVGLSVLAVFTYPACRRDSAMVADRSGWTPSFRRHLVIGVGVPLAGGLGFELLSLGSGGGLAVPGFMGAFVTIVLHPVAVFFATLGYLFRRRRHVASPS